jgi:RNase P subunit RPR2
MRPKAQAPRQIKTKFASTCKTCGTSIPKGINVYYFPADKAVYCLACGHDDYRQVMEAEADWQMYQAQNAGFFQNFS